MEEKIKRFIVENFMEGKGKLSNDESLFESGIIDSMGFITLLAFIEKTFGVSIDMSEITIENFDSIKKIVGVINKKTRGKSQ